MSLLIILNVYLKASQITLMELFANVVNGYKSLTMHAKNSFVYAGHGPPKCAFAVSVKF